MAIPNAIELLCPIEPTVRKSCLCPCPFCSRISKSSLLAFPVVETIGSSQVTDTICLIISSRFISFAFLYSIFASYERAPFLTTIAIFFPNFNFSENFVIASHNSFSSVSFDRTNTSIPISSSSLTVTSP